MDAGDLSLSRLSRIQTRSLSIRSAITPVSKGSKTRKMSGREESEGEEKGGVAGGRGGAKRGESVASSMSCKDRKCQLWY